MPISDQDGYESGHFSSVYRDLIKPSCEEAGFVPKRADEVASTNCIHVDIVRRLLDAPMAICDLSCRNPNVMFELGIRQAFQKPIVLICDEETPRIFDIDLIRIVRYSRQLKYADVVSSQKQITEALKQTHEEHGKTGFVNSVVELLQIEPPEIRGGAPFDLSMLQTMIERAVANGFQEASPQRVTHRPSVGNPPFGNPVNKRTRVLKDSIKSQFSNANILISLGEYDGARKALDDADYSIYKLIQLAVSPSDQARAADFRDKCIELREEIHRREKPGSQR